MRITNAWEAIDTYTERLRVPDGWIVRSSIEGMSFASIHQIFIADKTHQWTLEGKEDKRPLVEVTYLQKDTRKEAPPPPLNTSIKKLD